MENISLSPVAYVKNSRTNMQDDYWGDVMSEIVIFKDLPEECLDGVESFSHLEIIFYFNKSDKEMKGSAHPRENKAWPKVGIFAQRKKDRPNHIGTTIVELVKREGRVLTVKKLDADDGTPVLDIKPVVREFLPVGDITQPQWITELMQDYWK
jgi:tRNA-Thr(GGU) m(6)t(6)A37 methyltransferase TsaA